VTLIEALRERIGEPPLTDPPPVIVVRHRDLERALADTAELAPR
jgi:UPF0042 nucleotide-binding protein